MHMHYSLYYQKFPVLLSSALPASVLLCSYSLPQLLLLPTSPFLHFLNLFILSLCIQAIQNTSSFMLPEWRVGGGAIYSTNKTAFVLLVLLCLIPQQISASGRWNCRESSANSQKEQDGICQLALWGHRQAPGSTVDQCGDGTHTVEAEQVEVWL